ncbi:type I-E CRISPR-associated endoribonuclease Cas2e [Thiolapillus sp.]|uniref:type I-E CRISPR-associated endoribonuclease Cas2e n=1 Tax=Thiolapillus sp. TaxID=2017437 RepID=UPI003AF786F0
MLIGVSSYTGRRYPAPFVSGSSRWIFWPESVLISKKLLEESAVLVVIANDLPPAVRGRMKLWFVEPRANVFVSGVKDSVAKKVVEYLYKHCPPESGLMVFRQTS